MKKQTQVISSTRLCKELLYEGFNIIDIAPHRMDNKRTVFIFKNTDKLQKYLEGRKGEDDRAKQNTNNQSGHNT